MTTHVRRQRRGLDRIEQLLDAAAAVFARAGYDGATTNAIAAEAGVSPGTLYQFFTSKADLATALVERYSAELDRAHTRALTGFDPVTAPLSETIARILDPMIAFKDTHAAYTALFSRSVLPEPLAAPVGRIEAEFRQRLTAIVVGRNPRLDLDTAQVVAGTVLALVSGVMPVVTSDSELATELRRAILGYLREHNLR